MLSDLQGRAHPEDHFRILAEAQVGVKPDDELVIVRTRPSFRQQRSHARIEGDAWYQV
jgi:hypothetical protein